MESSVRCARVQLDPGAPGPGGRGSENRSRSKTALATQPGSQAAMFMGSEGCKDGTYTGAAATPGTLMEPEKSVTTVMINSSKSNAIAGKTEVK